MSNKLEKLYEMSLMKWGFDWLPATPTGTYLESYETFKQKIESDKVFYNQIIDELGVHIQERELSLEERVEIARKTLSKEKFDDYGYLSPFTTLIITCWLNQYNIPTRLITITYKNEKIEKFMNNIPITLTKEEWRCVNTWVESASNKTFERVSKSWFTELLEIIKPFYMSLYFSDDYSAMKIPYDSEHTLELEREYLRFLVYSVGRIAYDFDVKFQTAQVALVIVNKLENQGDENWKRNRY